MNDPPDGLPVESETAADGRYRRFWEDVGRSFPDLGEAPSTAVYLEDEKRLFRDHLPAIDGLRVFKSDLWDEAKNTRILRWAAEEGATCFGVDISPPIVAAASRGFRERRLFLRGAVADVRDLPFHDGSFDAVYSMGTVEHFAETDQAIGELFRVLRPGGTAIIGVPNRWDPFLRPLLVVLLSRVGLYGYGFEKSYSFRALRRLCEERGFRIEAETGILFMPGWLRMLDLALHAWFRPATVLTSPAVRLFAAITRRWPGVRRHGYLIALEARRPASTD